jgi:hypothetical protein
MNTTLLFAELLIVGLHTGIWLFILTLCVFGYDWLLSLQFSAFSAWQTTIAILSLSIFYVLGIITDRLADRIFSRWEKRVRTKEIPNPPLPIAVMRYSVGKDNEYLNRLFEYTRTRMRIARASSVNFGLMTLFTLIFIVINGLNFGGKGIWVGFLFVLLLGTFLTLTAVSTWHKLTRTYFGIVKDMFASREFISSTNSVPPNKGQTADKKRTTK